MPPDPPPLLRWLRRGLAAALAAGPLLVVLRGGFSADHLWGASSAGVLARVHAWWYVAQESPPLLGFPASAAGPLPDPLGRVAGPLVAALGAPGAVRLVLVLHALALVGVTARVLRGAGDTWGPVATAVFSTSPAVLALLAEGDPEALAGWTVLLPALARGWAAVPMGAAAAVLAPGLVPVGLLHGAVTAWPGADAARRRQLGGAAVVAAGVAWALGGPGGGVPEPGAWFAHVDPGPEPESFPTFVGFVPILLLALGLGAPAARSLVVGAAVALLLAAVRSPLPSERFLLLVPLYATLAAREVVARWAPAHAVTASLLVGALLLGEAWQGSAAGVPVPVSDLSVPAPLSALPAGPVLDLPATRSASHRSRYLQTLHGQPIASDAEGAVDPRVLDLTSRLAAGECPEVGALEFRAVLARREQAFFQLGKLSECLGTPIADDGRVAVWGLGE